MDMDAIDEEIKAAQAKRAYAPPLPEPAPGISPSPPTQPSGAPSPTGAAAQFFHDMMMYEQWKQTVYDTEQRKVTSIENRLRAAIEGQVRAELGAAVEMPDPIIQEGAKFLMDIFRQSAAQKMQAAPTPPRAPAMEQVQQTAGAPQQASPEETPVLFDPDIIADKIFEHYPADVLAFKAGKVSEADALAKIRMAGANEEQAAQILESLKNTEYPGETPTSTDPVSAPPGGQ